VFTLEVDEQEVLAVSKRFKNVLPQTFDGMLTYSNVRLKALLRQPQFDFIYNRHFCWTLAAADEDPCSNFLFGHVL
jgi:hypothetical protein